MKLTAEISFYPLNEEYKKPIKWFIERLNNYPSIERVTNAMATQVKGEYQEVMGMLAIEMEAAHEKFGKGVFICKFFGGELNITQK